MSISAVVRRARRFQDLLAVRGGDGPYVFTRMFRESDRGERRRARRHFKLLKRVDGTIREIVKPPERVMFLTEASGLSFWERWVLGWRRAVVLTDRRVVFLQLDSRRRPRLAHRQLAYGAVTGVDEGPRGGLEVSMRGGGTLTLRGLRTADGAALTEGIRSGARGSAHAPVPRGVEWLCPYCHVALEGRPRACPSCLRGFRRSWWSALSSLAVPGLGNYRIGYRGFAVLELLAALGVWAAYIARPDVGGMSEVWSALAPGWIFAVVHGGDAALTWHVARSGVFLSEES